MNPSTKDRIFGLDLLRATAILIVTIGHSNTLFPYSIGFTIRLPDGVDLFFVLSGFLIGSILLKTIEEHKVINLRVTLHFLIRRWFRTLPNYFLFLLINVILVYYSLIPGQVNKFIITYFCFFQNFYKPYEFIYWESWSLAVEEWFYVLFPILISLIFVIKKPTSNLIRKNIFFFSILIIIIFPLIYRFTQVSETLNTDLYFRKLVLTRLDTIGFGILAAYINFYYSNFWKKNKNILFIIGMTIMITLLINKNQLSTFFNQTIYFSISSLSITLIIPKLSQLKSGSVFSKPIKYLSKISYSMYLVNLPVFFILNNSNLIQDFPLVRFLLYWIFVILISDLIFRFYESPIMHLREKINIKKP